MVHAKPPWSSPGYPERKPTNSFRNNDIEEREGNKQTQQKCIISIYLFLRERKKGREKERKVITVRTHLTIDRTYKIYRSRKYQVIHIYSL